MKLLKSVMPVIIAAVIVTGCIKQAETKNMSEKNEVISKRLGSLIKVRPEFEERYIILHKHTFPGVLESIRRCNIRNYSIFLLDGLLFSHLEYVGTNYDADMKAIGDETTKEWWKLTDPMQEPLPTRKEGEWWAGMELLYNSDHKIKSYTDAKRFAMVADVDDTKLDELRKDINSVSKEQIDALTKANIQNVTFYTKDGRIYMYGEYVGKDYEKDKGTLEAEKATLNSKAVLQKYIKSQWLPMKEVFHTN